MCGSFDYGGVKKADGTSFPLTGVYETDKTNSINLAISWMIAPANSLFDDPSAICDPSSSCGGAGDAFACDAIRRQLQVNPGCTRTCTDIDAQFQQFREQCQKDIDLTGDDTWACAPAYLNPTVSFERNVPTQLVWDLKGTFEAAPDTAFTNQVCAAMYATLEPCADIGFGSLVAISGNKAAVASRSGYSPSSVRIYTVPSTGEAPGSWVEYQRIVVDDGSTTAWYGYGIALDGDTLVVAVYDGAPADYQNVAAKAFLYVESGGTWAEQQEISLTSLTNCCGIIPVALNGDTVVIGDEFGAEVASVYFRMGGIWSQQQVLTANDSTTGDFFGASVDIDGDTIVVGAPGSEEGNGKAYVFTRSGTTWLQQAILEPDASAIPSAPNVLGFGASVAVDGDLAVIGSKFNGDSFGYVSFGGSVDIFRVSGTTWTREGPLNNGGLSVDERSYGVSVDVKDGIVLVGVKEMYAETYGNGPADVWGYGDFDGYPGGMLLSIQVFP